MVEPNAASPPEPGSPEPSDSDGPDGLRADPGSTSDEADASPHGAADAAGEHTADAGSDAHPPRASTGPGALGPWSEARDLSTDERFAQIVAGLEDSGREDDDLSPAEDPSPGREWSVPAAPWVRQPGPRDQDTTPELEELEEEQSHFTEPEPGVVLGSDPLTNLAWLAVVLVPVGFLVCTILWRAVPPLVLIGAGLVFAAGLTVLLWRMPSRREPDDHDPGAIV